MKSTAMRVAGVLLALTLMVPSMPALADPPAPGPNEAAIQHQIETLFFQTGAVATASGFTQGERTSLVTKLVSARSAIIRGNDDAAFNKLGAFINEVNALEQSGRLSPADAEALRSQAVVIRNQIANPVV